MLTSVAAFGRKPQIEKNAALCRVAATFSLHRVHQRREPLNPHFVAVAGLNRAAMPLGVPVRITSPGSSVIFVEIKLTSSAGLKMSCFVFEFWRNWPFWKSWMVNSCGSIFVFT
jgi:hypothetical protein